MKILFVCTGNTCRSPMAEGIFRKMAADRGLEGEVLCRSAGLSAIEGDPVSPNAAEVCREIGVDLSGHRARRLTGSELPMWDVYFPMSRTHAYILEQAGVPSDSIYLPSPIDDPYGGDLAVYRRCREKLERELEIFYNTVVEKIKFRE